MKHVKRLASVLLAMVMVLAMGVTAFATEPEGDGGDNSSDGGKKEVTHTYEIYQIFTGDYSEGGVLSNIKWGQNGTGTKDEKVDKDVLKALEAVQNATSDTEKLKVINKYANLSSTPIETGSGTEYTDLKPGYYLVKDKDGSLNGTGDAYTLYVVQVVDGTLTFKPKSDVPKVDKKIVEDGKEVENNSASIGDEVNYEITGTLPSNYDAYRTYYYKFSDTLSKGLTYKEDSLVITIDGTKRNIDDLGGSLVITKPEPGETKIEVTIPDLKKVSGVTKASEIVITYTATLNKDAAIGVSGGNSNKVKVEYSNDPNYSGDGEKGPKGETPEDKVTTYTTELVITKTDEKNNFLPGVEFTLTGDNMNIVVVTSSVYKEDPAGEYWKLKDGTYTKEAPVDNEDAYESTTQKYTLTPETVTKGNEQTEVNVIGVVGPDGKVKFTGLGKGTYTITESKTLDGYNTIEPIEFTIGFNVNNDGTGEFTATSPIYLDKNNNYNLAADIVNTSGSLLPSTGGIGTTIFYIVGGVLVVGAAILLIAKKRAK